MKTFFTPEGSHSSLNTITWQVIDKDLEKAETLSFKHSQHSFERSNQRNINTHNISEAIEYGIAYFKQGLIFYVLGENNLPNHKRKRYGNNNNNNNNNNNANLIVVIAGDSNTILTCYRARRPFKHIKKKQKNLENRNSFTS
jgi:hypothetical protein